MTFDNTRDSHHIGEELMPIERSLCRNTRSSRDRFAALVPISLRNLDAIRVADFLALIGDRVVRAKLSQNLRLRSLPESYLSNVFHLVGELVELASGSRLLRNSTACTGADTCNLGICLFPMVHCLWPTG